MNSRRIIDCVMRGDKKKQHAFFVRVSITSKLKLTLEQSVAIAYNTQSMKVTPQMPLPRQQSKVSQIPHLILQ